MTTVTSTSTAPLEPAADATPAEVAATPVPPTFDLDAAWTVHEQVSIRPERFGALVYHFGTRQLSFLKSPTLLAVVNGLATSSSAREACAAAGVTPAQQAQYRTALATLAASQTIRSR